MSQSESEPVEHRTGSGSFPDAQPHGQVTQIFDDVFFVSGGVRLAGPLPMSFSRNMTVVRDGDELTLINSVRLSPEGLAQLDALGKVKHVIRICGFHGMDDPFYKHHYGATVWAIKGQVYARGFNNAKSDPKTYFQADKWLAQAGSGSLDSALPIKGASLYLFKSASPPEGMVLLERAGGVLVSGDCLQNWAKTDQYFNFAAKGVMKLMGFIKPHNIGPGWFKSAKPQVSEIRALLDLPFNSVLPAHGAPVLADAKAAFRPAIERLA